MHLFYCSQMQQSEKPFYQYCVDIGVPIKSWNAVTGLVKVKNVTAQMNLNKSCYKLYAEMS